MEGKYVAFLFTNTQFIKESKTWNVRLNRNLRSFCLSQNKILLFFLGHLKKQVDVVPMGSYCPTFLNVFLV